VAFIRRRGRIKPEKSENGYQSETQGNPEKYRCSLHCLGLPRSSILVLFFSLITPGFSLISSSCWCWCWCCCCFRDERFSNEEHYEWFKNYSHFRHLIQAHIKPNSSVIFLSLSLFFFFFLIGIQFVKFTNL
jgi:hypothetical protein